MPEMPFSEWKCRNKSSRTWRLSPARPTDASNNEEEPADAGEVLLTLCEVVVEKFRERRILLRRGISRHSGAPPSSPLTVESSACGTNGLVM